MAALPGALEDNGRHAHGMAWYCVDIIDNIICFPTVEVGRLSLFISPPRSGYRIDNTQKARWLSHPAPLRYAQGYRRHRPRPFHCAPSSPEDATQLTTPPTVHAMPCPRDRVPGRQRGVARRACGDLRREDRRLTCRDRKETRASGSARWQALRLLLALSQYEWREAVANFFTASPLLRLLSRRRRWTARAEWPGALAALRFALSPDLSARSNASRVLCIRPLASLLRARRRRSWLQGPGRG
jgi:hypothetical protein